MRLELVIGAILSVASNYAALHVGQFGQLSMEFKDQIVHGSNYNIDDIGSAVECLSFCTKDIQCQSFFYRSNDKICQLYKFVYFSDAHWISSPGTSYGVMYEDNCPVNEDYIFNRATRMCYKIHTETKTTWPDARQTCLSESGDLISLDSLQKYYHIVDTIRESPVLSDNSNGIFVGGINDLPGGDWRWLSNVLLKTDSPIWGAGMPGSNDHSLRYARISNNVEQGLDDTPINDVYFFICEIFI